VDSPLAAAVSEGSSRSRQTIPINYVIVSLKAQSDIFMMATSIIVFAERHSSRVKKWSSRAVEALLDPPVILLSFQPNSVLTYMCFKQ
jgi:hypothetical protein